MAVILRQRDKIQPIPVHLYLAKKKKWSGLSLWKKGGLLGEKAIYQRALKE
jgi:hypothetical protein